MSWSSHDQYGIFHQSSRFRPQSPLDARLAGRLERMQEEMQAAYWKSLYPEKVRKIQHEVEETCERLDYAGSFLYDEYPDRFNLDRTGKEICTRLRQKEPALEVPLEELYETNSPKKPPSPPPKPPRGDDWLEDIVRILLYQEIDRRRGRKRCCNGRSCDYKKGGFFDKGCFDCR